MQTPWSVAARAALCVILAFPFAMPSAHAGEIEFDTLSGRYTKPSGNWFEKVPEDLSIESSKGEQQPKKGAAYRVVTPLETTLSNWYATSATPPSRSQLYLVLGQGPVGSMAFTDKYDLAGNDAHDAQIRIWIAPETSIMKLAMLGLLMGAAVMGMQRKPVIPA